LHQLAAFFFEDAASYRTFRVQGVRCIVCIATLLVATAIDDAGYLAPSQGSGTHGAAAARRATTINTYTTTTNSYTFTGLDTNKRYTYRVRTVGEENIYSQWSEEKTFEFGGTGVVSVFSSEKETATRFFDLQGREVKTPTHGLYIRNGKKVVVK
jgi:hypothetical protein